jgi:hypothetical protein
MTDSKRRLVGMGIPFALAFLPDTVLSIFSHSVIADGLLFRALARLHPEADILGYVAWAGAIVGLLLLTPELLAVILTIAVVFGHVVGAYFQLTVFLGSWWYQAANGLFLLAAVALGTGLTWSARAASVAEHTVSGKPLPAWLRWGLIAFLSVVALGTIWHP